MNTRTILSFALALSALFILVINIFTGGAAAHDIPRSGSPGFGLVTLASGQGLRLNLVNTRIAQPNLPPSPCIARVTFVDSEGNQIGNAQTSELGPGESLSTEATELVAAGRMVATRLRPVVQVSDSTTIGSENHLPPSPCVPTLEVFDVDSGRTSFLMDGVGRTQPLSTLIIREESR